MRYRAPLAYAMMDARDPVRALPESLCVNGAINLSTVGISLDIVGIIFLANSMGIRNPRRFIQEHVGIERQQPLRAVHHQLKVKAQIFTGFLFLMVGFSLQIAAAVLGGGESVAAALDAGEKARTMLILLTGIVATTFLLRLVQSAWSLAVFRRLLTEFFQDHRDWNFEKHPSSTKEIGEILGVPRRAEDSISEYADRVQAALKLRGEDRRPVADDAFAPIRNVGADRRQ